MLEIKIDLIPYGQREWRRTIGTIVISNDGTGDSEMGNYKYTVENDSLKIQGKLKKYNRSQSVFYLLKKVLNKAFK